jgi:hypothetical protein
MIRKAAIIILFATLTFAMFSSCASRKRDRYNNCPTFGQTVSASHERALAENQ